MSYHFKCLHILSAKDVHVLVSFVIFPRKMLYLCENIANIGRSHGIFRESRTSTFYHVVAHLKLCHDHTTCGAWCKTETMLQIPYLIGSLRTLQTKCLEFNSKKRHESNQSRPITDPVFFRADQFPRKILNEKIVMLLMLCQPLS